MRISETTRPSITRTMVQIGALLCAFNLFMPTAIAQVAPEVAPMSDRPIRIVALGDSLTAGYLLPPKDAFPAQLERALIAKGHRIEMANAGVSGDTASGGLERLQWSVPDPTDLVILELGANDALRGIDPKITRAALESIISQLKARNIEVLLAGMLSLPNWGNAYAEEFNKIYPELAAKHGLIFYPFFLDGVAAKAELNLPDGLHPTAEGIGIIVDRILPSVEQVFTRVKAPERSP